MVEHGTEETGPKRDGRLKLVVIMAIVSGVAAITIPSLDGFHGIPRSRAYRALAEIRNIELALTKLLGDAGRNDLRAFIDSAAFDAAVKERCKGGTLDRFAASVALYTETFYGLLEHGRGAVAVDNDVSALLNREEVSRLGVSYFSEVPEDPWGNPYQIFLGPWPDGMGPVLFRDYRQSPPGVTARATAPDGLMLVGSDPGSGETYPFGYPANKKTHCYVWSFGANEISGQAVYDPTHAYAPPASGHYHEQSPEYMGGGDDINNWDNEQSFMRFYNATRPGIFGCRP